ncbi:DUF3536 domain-containing protein [Pampinifervens florentissimum]|uniref:DUF3536 domain-containing protein n=1 Tax=Pampinifervens florentissimum TaxID=1632019 RepID=UPI0013B497BC|nr:DUF3536 domain-containing protein [Hydrogenobacter sp. T-8]QID33743.1 DUF3536 domain-containing protein [Hydrogenobacter sp. T-8]
MSLLCVHCHFHQPPRENPYLGLITLEPSAQPFENWNERIFRESYLPNLYAHYRKGGKILKVVNNYEHVSFNFTFTLISWLFREKYWFIDRLKGAGKNAIATSFNHTILPLDPEEDREVQIVWGIRAFEKVFGRKPLGFWLPELAVDRKTLSLLVKHGIKYVILAPHQVKTKGSYLRHNLPEGHIDIFVYDGELSHGIAFGDLINHMDEVIRIASARKGLTLIAVDGETFGHHKKFGEMGLAYLVENYPNMKTIEELYKTMHPEGETEIWEFTSWSCAHGIERWRSDCGCTTGGLHGWHQKWRGPMREALEMVRSEVRERLFRVLEKYTKDPQSALFDFADILLGGSKEEYLQDKAKRSLSKEERVELFKHLYAYKYISYAFSSDGWFFADISGIEAVKNLLFAKKAIDLIGNGELEERFLRVLSEAPSNLQSYGSGLGVWHSLVLPQKVSERQVITSITALELSDVIPQEGTLGNFYYRVEGFEPWKVYLKDMETEEEFEDMEELKEFNTNNVPQPLLSWLLDKWALAYLSEAVNFTENHELLLEDLLVHARGKYFEAGNLIESNVEAYLRLKLYLLLRELAPVKEIKRVLEKADYLNLNVRNVSVKFWMERYISKKILMGISEEEAKEIVTFIKEYNTAVGRYDLMVNLWDLQNWAWENREKLSPETLSLLEFA